MKTAKLLTLGLLGGSASFNPLSIPGLALWLDASDASTLFQTNNGTTPATADSDPVGYWGDKSSNGRNVTQGTAGSKPALKLTIKNGKNVIRFDGGDVLSAGDVLDMGTNSVTMFVAGSATGGNGTYLGKTLANALAGRYGLLYATFSLYVTYQNAGGTFTPNVVRSDAGPEIVTGAISRAGSNVLYINGTAVNTVNFTADSGENHNTALPFSVGAMRNSTDTDYGIYLTGDIYEALVFLRPTVLTAQEMSSVHSYLNAKWAVY